MRLIHCLSVLARFRIAVPPKPSARSGAFNRSDGLAYSARLRRCERQADAGRPLWRLPARERGNGASTSTNRRHTIGTTSPTSGHPLGFQRHDAYPIIDRRYGGVVSANDFDFDYSEPYGVMHPGDGDGYDVYRVANGWVTGGDTRDGGGYSQSFFGADCKPFGGWVLFPVSFLRELRPGAQGRTMAPIHGSYWEQAGLPWPGRLRAGQGILDVNADDMVLLART